MKKHNITFFFALLFLSTILANAQAPPPNAPSFDCNKATSRVEKIICSNPELAAADVRLLSVYRAAAAASVEPSIERDAQLSWLKERNTCPDATCILRAYNTRISALSGLQASVERARQTPQNSYIVRLSRPTHTLRLRSEPSTQGEVLTLMPHESVVTVLSKRTDGWWRVRDVSGAEGWTLAVQDGAENLVALSAPRIEQQTPAATPPLQLGQLQPRPQQGGSNPTADELRTQQLVDQFNSQVPAERERQRQYQLQLEQERAAAFQRYQDQEAARARVEAEQRAMAEARLRRDAEARLENARRAEEQERRAREEQQRQRSDYEREMAAERAREERRLELARLESERARLAGEAERARAVAEAERSRAAAEADRTRLAAETERARVAAIMTAEQERSRQLALQQRAVAQAGAVAPAAKLQSTASTQSAASTSPLNINDFLIYFYYIILIFLLYIFYFFIKKWNLIQLYKVTVADER